MSLALEEEARARRREAHIPVPLGITCAERERRTAAANE